MRRAIALIAVGLALFFCVSVDQAGWRAALQGWAIFGAILSISTGLALLAAGPRP